ncbi:E1 ubiquitin-activating protein aos1 [Ophidiomyces ophidiicola]|nr:E1 ubiquitin-activating protein aos1 [Ophidiomyces ophidiicola]KAI1966117.1 E1 ubiquitin-activating protein aos1 [Ophidiomyces ophidiicola]
MAATHNNSNPISADEIALYDRQIRLWGLKAQERIRTSKILLISIKALGNEIAKNLVLAGIGSLTILDDQIVCEEDLGAQFFLSADDIGKYRVIAASQQIKQMNPRVHVEADSSDAGTKSPEYFSRFDIIIATDMRFEAFATINAACRVVHRPCYVAGSHGLYGFIFADLIRHEFVIEREKSNMPPQSQETMTRVVLHVTRKVEKDRVIETVTKRETYTPLLLANTSPLPDEFTKVARKRRQVTPVLTCIRALWEFQRLRAGWFPSFSREDLELFTRLANECHLELKLDPSTLTAEFLRSFISNIGTEINPVVAFLGGYLAQDAINFLSAREQPLQNFLFFDGDKNISPIYSLHPFFPSPDEKKTLAGSGQGSQESMGLG